MANPLISLKFPYPFWARFLGREGTVSVLFETDQNGKLIKWTYEKESNQEFKKVVERVLRCNADNIKLDLPDGMLKAKEIIYFKMAHRNGTEFDLRKYRKRMFINVVLSFAIFVVIGLLIRDNIVSKYKAELVCNRLESELLNIKSMPNSVLVNHIFDHRPRNASVGNTFSSPSSYSEVSAYFDAQLKKNGWDFLSENTIVKRNGNSEEHNRYYRKGNFSAKLDYAGYNPNCKWVYALELSYKSDAFMDILQFIKRNSRPNKRLNS
jgi:hypothetical protein